MGEAEVGPVGSPRHEATSQDSTRASSRWTLSRVSVIVMLALVGVAIALWLITSSGMRGQERRLLGERAREVASTLSNAVDQDKASLALLAGVPARAKNPAGGFAAAADQFLTKGVKTIGVAQVHGGRVEVTTAVGNGPRAGQRLSGGRAALVDRALVARNLVAAVLHDRTGAALTVAVPGPDGAVAYEESAIAPAHPIAATQNSPYSELDLAVYATPRVDPSELILTTSARSLVSGSVDRRTIVVGADRWLLLTASRRPLVGSFAASIPWAVLVIGLLSAALVATVVEMLARRRRYAMSIVDQRTAELRQALAEQVRLEQEQRKAKDTADAANQAKNEFLSRMSHELRTPLNAIIGFGQLLQMDEVDERQREPIEHILKGGRHLLELINEVLDLSRIESGQLPISPEPVPLKETVREAVDLVGPLAAKQGITVSANTTELSGDGHVYADRQRLKQVMLNLLSNAIKYNRVGGRVELSFSHPSEERIRIIVADTGIGIAPEQLAGVFEPFERLGAELGEIEGTGLGLALSRRLVEAMGGTIELESKLGEGTTLTIELQATDAPGTDATSNGHSDRPHHALGNSNGHRHRILYIEDNLSNLKLVQRILERQPAIELIPAMQGTIGLELAREHQPELIVLDLHLPAMSGEEVLRRLKADQSTSAIPVIVLSAEASPRQVSRLLRSGAHDYLTKPLDVQRFLEAIASNLPTSDITSLPEAPVTAQA